MEGRAGRSIVLAAPLAAEEAAAPPPPPSCMLVLLLLMNVGPVAKSPFCPVCAADVEAGAPTLLPLSLRLMVLLGAPLGEVLLILSKNCINKSPVVESSEKS